MTPLEKQTNEKVKQNHGSRFTLQNQSDNQRKEKCQ